MATDLGGYDCNFVEQPPDDLICLICTFVAKDPQQLTCCGKIYCRACLVEHKKHSPTCPQCRRRGESFEDKKSDRSIKQLKVKCSNASRGCQWIGELLALKGHCTKCHYTLTKCPNKCKYKSKRVKKVFKELSEHLETQCPNRLQSRSKVLCTNEGCRCCITRDELFIHRDQCAFERVPCKYAHAGCSAELIRKDLERHENNTLVYQHHHRLAGCERAHTEDNEPTVQLHFTFVLTNFNYLKNKDMAFCSPPFHSQHGGYKLSLRVDTNGWATGHCTHVSVRLHLMRGENDDQLHWPFIGQITVTLLNQLQDDRHHEVTFHYINQRVMGRDRSTLGYGPLHYISHSDLGYHSGLNRQYLKDDCLFFRVTVDAPPLIKPWLYSNSDAVS